ncbi:MAG: PAS domain S-box protein [Dehalococcoidia bacterium]
MSFDLTDSPLAAFLPVLNGSLDPIGIVDEAGYYLWINDAGERFFGYDRAQVVGTHFRKLLVETEEPGDAMRRAVLGNAAAVVRRVRRRDGTVVVVRTELIPLPGELVLIHGTDLTALYDTFDRVAESEGVLARAQEIGHTGSWVLRLPERTVRWFGPTGDQMGMPTTGIFSGGDVAEALVHPDDLAIPRDLVHRAIEDGAADGVFRTNPGDGKTHWLRMYAQAVHENGAITRVEGVVHDITDYREQEERYRELLEAVRVPMLIWTRGDDSGPARMRYVNGPLCDLVGSTPEQMIGQQPGGWLVEEERAAVAEYVTAVARGEQASPKQMRVRRADGTLVTCLLVAAPVTYEGATALCAQIIDISEEVRLREVAARSRETDVALAVAGGVAHDFNNLLTGVLGYLDFAAAELDEDSPEGRYVAAARLAARRAANLAQALLGYSRSSAHEHDGELPPVIDPTRVVDVTDVMREAYAVTRAAIDRRVGMTTHEGEAEAHAAIPADSLLRVLVNLVVNSRDAVLERQAAEDGDYRPQIDLGVEADPAAGTVSVTVTDNGAGIPEAVAGRVFEPYFTTKSANGGSGIGLRGARDLARAAGGELDFTSEVGVGTTFRLVLPLVAAPPSIDF